MSAKVNKTNKYKSYHIFEPARKKRDGTESSILFTAKLQLGIMKHPWFNKLEETDTHDIYTRKDNTAALLSFSEPFVFVLNKYKNGVHNVLMLTPKYSYVDKNGVEQQVKRPVYSNFANNGSIDIVDELMVEALSYFIKVKDTKTVDKIVNAIKLTKDKYICSSLIVEKFPGQLLYNLTDEDFQAIMLSVHSQKQKLYNEEVKGNAK